MGFSLLLLGAQRRSFLSKEHLRILIVEVPELGTFSPEALVNGIVATLQGDKSTSPGSDLVCEPSLVYPGAQILNIAHSRVGACEATS